MKLLSHRDQPWSSSFHGLRKVSKQTPGPDLSAGGPGGRRLFSGCVIYREVVSNLQILPSAACKKDRWLWCGGHQAIAGRDRASKHGAEWWCIVPHWTQDRIGVPIWGSSKNAITATAKTHVMKALNPRDVPCASSSHSLDRAAAHRPAPDWSVGRPSFKIISRKIDFSGPLTIITLSTIYRFSFLTLREVVVVGTINILRKSLFFCYPLKF